MLGWEEAEIWAEVVGCDVRDEAGGFGTADQSLDLGGVQGCFFFGFGEFGGFGGAGFVGLGLGFGFGLGWGWGFGAPRDALARERRGSSSSASGPLLSRVFVDVARAGSAAICSAVVPRDRLITTPGDSSGSAASAGSVTSSAIPRANRSWSLPHAASAAFWLGAAT